MTATKSFNEQEAAAQILASVPLLRAFIECSDTLQSRAKQLIRAMAAPDSDDEDRYLAATTLLEILEPYWNESDDYLGMDLEAANRLVRNHGLPPEHRDAADCDQAAAELDAMDAEEASFAERLNRLMLDRGMTQSDLAERIGVGQSAIAMMLKRQCRPQKRTVHRIADALGISPSELWLDA